MPKPMQYKQNNVRTAAPTRPRFSANVFPLVVGAALFLAPSLLRAQTATNAAPVPTDSVTVDSSKPAETTTNLSPIQVELQTLVQTVQGKKNHSQGLKIVGISLDSDRDKLTAFLKQQEGVTWPQYIDGEGETNKLAVQYGVSTIPFTILVGTDGKIIGKDLDSDDLGDAVAAALAKK